MSKTARFVSTSLLLLLVATAAAAPDVRSDAALVAYVPSADAAVNAAIVRGLREVLEPRGVRLLVGRVPERWSNAAPETVRLALELGADVLITPPDRRVAHLMAQVATRTQVQVVTTSSAPTVGATGSTWVVGVDGTSAYERGRNAGLEALRFLRAP